MYKQLIIQAIAVIFGIYIAFSHKKRTVLIATLAYNLICLILSFIIKDFSALYSYILINARSFIFLYQDKLKTHKLANVIPAGICILHIILGAVSANKWYQVFTIIGPVILTASLWYEDNRQRMRIEQSLSDSMWLIYNAFAGLYILCITRIFIIVASLFAIYRNRKTNG